MPSVSPCDLGLGCGSGYWGPEVGGVGGGMVCAYSSEVV